MGPLVASNPFLDTYTEPLTLWRGIVLLLLAPLCVLRLCLALGMMLVYSVLCWTLHDRAGDPLRKRFRRYPLVVEASRLGSVLCLRVLGFRFKVSGWDNAERWFSRPGCPIIVMNHVSYMDIIVAVAIFGPFFPVARDDMKDWPLIGRVLRMWGFIGVPREASGGHKGAGLAAALTERAARAEGPWMECPPVVIFPEGTCTTGREMIRFRSGAFVPGRPVLPVALKYVVPNGMSCGWVLTQQAVAAPLWRRVPKDLTHLLRILAARGKCIEVNIAPMYVPTPDEAKDPAKFAANVRREMCKLIDVPLDCDFDSSDAREFYKRVDRATARVVTIRR